ncbi:MAG: two-component system sensor histidine kinase NtrB [Sediminispirochaetaceae bacterium]
MRNFIRRALNKLPKLDKEQIRTLLFDLASENEKLETVLHSMSEGILVTDTEHRVVFYNTAAVQMLPVWKNDMEELLVWKVVDDHDLSEFFEDVLTNGEEAEDEEFTLGKGNVKWTLSFRITQLRREKEWWGNLVIFSDITEKRKREARLRRAESLASLTTLAAGVAHEIQNPLGSIGIHIQLIQKALKKNHCLDEETANKYLEVIDEEIERLNGIVVDFLFAVRPMDTELKKADLNKVIEDLVGFVKYEAEESGVHVETKLGSTISKVEIDEKFIKQALMNIVKNGIAAMEGGGVLTISTREDEGYVHTDISDTGVGISDEKITKIFEPYYTTKDFGSGLGLTVVYKVVREHGGEISVQSQEGEGTTFTISLPVPESEKKLLGWNGEEEK